MYYAITHFDVTVTKDKLGCLDLNVTETFLRKQQINKDFEFRQEVTKEENSLINSFVSQELKLSDHEETHSGWR